MAKEHPKTETSPAEPHIGIIATSLNPDSRSQKLAAFLTERLKLKNVHYTLIDFRKHSLPLAGTEESWKHTDIDLIRNQLQKATHFLFAVPIYNYDVNSAAKAFIEFLGEDVLKDKTIGFLCAAGGQNSFMALLPFANSLMLDFRCWIVPRFVHVTGNFDGKKIDQTLIRRIDELIESLLSRKH